MQGAFPGSSGIGFLYGLDANGNRVTITENDGSQTVNTFDAKNRLTNEVRSGTSPYSNQYAYDLSDNLTSRSLPGGAVSFTVDIMGQITSDSDSAGRSGVAGMRR